MYIIDEDLSQGQIGQLDGGAAGQQQGFLSVRFDRVRSNINTPIIPHTDLVSQIKFSSTLEGRCSGT